MKKLCFALLLLCGTPAAFCQVDSVPVATQTTTTDAFDPGAVAIDEDSSSTTATTNDTDEVIGGTDDLNFSQDIAQTPSVQSFQAPVASYSKVFLESEIMIGLHEAAVGLHAAFVDKRFGIYGSYLWGSYYNWMSFGAVWRPVARPASVDWQIYAGPAFGRGMGVEVGTRFAAGADTNPTIFSWVSGTVSFIDTFDYQFITCGLSLDLSGLMLFYLW